MERTRKWGFQRYKDNAGEYRWHFKSPNGKIMADSAEGYAFKEGCNRAMVRFAQYVIKAEAEKRGGTDA